jgi:hypothetical protein
MALLGAALLVILIVRIGPGAIAAQFSRLGPEVIWLAVPYAIGTAIGAFPWAWLLPESARPRARAVLASRFAASSANAVLPFFGVAGEPMRLLWMRGEARAEGVAAIVVDRLLYNAGSGLFLMLGAVTALSMLGVHSGIGLLAAALALVVLAITAALAWIVSRFGVVQWIRKLLRKFLAGMYAERGFGDEVEAALRRLLAGSKLELLKYVWAHFLGRFAIGIEVYLALKILHVPVGADAALVLATVPVATALVGSSIPSQIGVQEAGLVLTCNALGIDAAVGFTLVLLQRLRQIAYVALLPILLAGARPTSGTLEHPQTPRTAA